MCERSLVWDQEETQKMLEGVTCLEKWEGYKKCAKSNKLIREQLKKKHNMGIDEAKHIQGDLEVKKEIQLSNRKGNETCHILTHCVDSHVYAWNRDWIKINVVVGSRKSFKNEQ